MLTLYLKEIRSFLSSLIGYIAIGVFISLVGIFMWIIPSESGGSNVLDNGFANIDPLFFIAPWVYLFLIPAITMRSFSEEKKTGTIELLLTRPLTDLQLVLAKYFAGVTLLIIAIIPTFVYYISMYNLGNPVGIIDTGATLTSYLGLILLGSTFVAIGIFASSITNSQIVAFILGMFLCWIFYDGLNLIGSFNQMGSFDSVIQYCGMTYHFDSIKRGVVDTSDLVYFISIIFLFIYSALTVIKTLKK